MGFASVISNLLYFGTALNLGTDNSSFICDVMTEPKFSILFSGFFMDLIFFKD